MTTRKHLDRAGGDVLEIEKTPKNPTGYNCKCGKYYICYGSLWRHKKKCIPIEIKESVSPTEITTELVLELVKQNKELQDLLRNELIQVKNQSTTNNSHNTNSNNSFNLNFFLNEQCKDAVNIMDFVESLKIGIKDLERTGQLGYVDGISSILLDGLKEMDVYSRPIHCTDLKRETVYLKNMNKWEKEDDNKTNLKIVINKVARKNLQQITKWKEENPECMDTQSVASDQFVTISQKSIGGADAEEEEKYQNTIIKNVLKETTLKNKATITSQ